jgi:peptidoglycan/LPS O-acetylase OafA/YrhL
MKYGWLDDSKGFVPEPKILLVYLIFFAGGWLIYRSADQLPTLAPTHRFLISLILGFAAQCGAFACVTALRGSAANVPRLCLFSCAALNAFAMWAYIFGLIGLFMRFLSKPRRWLRWLSDSSYWLYLAHMPVFLIIQIALVHAGLHAIAKLGILLAISIPVLLASYQFLVRPTFIGAILNGRKYPRGSIEHKHRVQDRSFADI